MKYLALLIILASFLPLQSGLGCKAPLNFSSEMDSCHKKMGHKMQSVSMDKGHILKHGENHSDCLFCQSGNCDNPALMQESWDFCRDKGSNLADCQPQNRFILPFDLFLLPIEERAPPGHRPEKRLPILSYDWQAFYSIFLI